MTRPLFGGAMSAVLPLNTKDISELREIPDNQEVFAHTHTDQSIIIELLEYQSHVEDSQAARYHFEDIAGSNKAMDAGQMEVMEVQCVPQAQLSLSQCCSAWSLTGAQLISKFNEEAKNIVNIHLCLFRLPQYSTDILITFNDPVSISSLSSSSSAVADGVWTVQDFHTLVQSFQLLDPGVFG
ncbi:ran guanine nucleotide release factor [Pangasianodon hypophthalmus]|uniref:ran guanine nucleotide release factor n=1 Tax=Pangasianodon hypophthalmus TaxID=310915 RepID=UPI002307E232|nr:ran guanine nucleotide release factor [Pangasianodon hypophthalmus]XP_053086496.1 ran guanine nucleotide release factor [Pangasianodon hypophthalmus]